MRQAIGRFLHERGFNCMSHSSGLLALAEMAREPPALVITDSEAVGGMDGYGLLSRIKSDWRLCGVPVVLLTARGLPADRISGYRAGASAYVAAVRRNPKKSGSDEDSCSAIASPLTCKAASRPVDLKRDGHKQQPRP